VLVKRDVRRLRHDHLCERFVSHNNVDDSRGDSTMASDEAAGRQGAHEAGPILGTPDDFPERPPGRVGLVAYVVIGLIVALAAGGWGYVMLAAHGNPQVSVELVSFDTTPGSAQVTFIVHKSADRAATCLIRAVDDQHLEVGSREIDVPRGGSDVSFTEQVRTSTQATTVQVDDCDLV
jgi:Domain of unknown function (DUF4307)